LKIAKKLEKEIKGVRVENHEKNRGYGAALKTGFYKTKYDWIVFTDSDGQFEFSEITEFIQKQEKTGADLVIGYYKDRKVPLYRKLNSKMWEFFVFLLFGLKVKDIDCGFKLISRGVINGIPKLESERGAFISSEFLIKAKKKGFKIVEIGVTHHPREEGSGTGANLDVIISSFIDLVKLWRKLRKRKN
jgi:glycosyltransferase involved in cell wall biosynthesis